MPIEISKNNLVALFLVLTIAISLRIYSLGDSSLWADEAVYANNSFASFGEFINNTRTQNSSPILLPLIYWTLGDLVRDPFLIRFLPMTFGVLAVYILFQLSTVGVYRPAAVMSSAWLAIMPWQVQYSQEVREYSLSVLISALLLYFFLKATSASEQSKFPFGFCCCLILAPLSAYGNIFIAGLLLAMYLGIGIERRRLSTRALFTLSAAFILSLTLSWLITARYQIGLAKPYLDDSFPPDGWLAAASWVVQSNGSYFSSLLGGIAPAAISLVAVVAFSCVALKRRLLFTSEIYIVAAFLALAAASNALSLMGLYPFGGIRQHLFASPIAIVAATTSIFWFARRSKRDFVWPIVFFLAFVIPGAVNNMQSAYADRSDIHSPISDIGLENDDQSVFVYPGASAAVIFHYPQREFYFSNSERGDLGSMAQEVSGLPGCINYLVFSQVLNDDDSRLSAQLLELGYVVRIDNTYVGSRLIAVEKLIHVDGCQPNS